MDFCEKIIRLRKARRMTQDDLARAVGVTRQSVYKWERGQSYPEAMKLVALKELFGVSIDRLLDPAAEVEGPLHFARSPENGRNRVRFHAVRTPSDPWDEARKEPHRIAADGAEADAIPVGQPAYDDGRTPQAQPVGADKGQETPKEKEKEKKPGFFARLFGRK